jgi:hypothetical protein
MRHALRFGKIMLVGGFAALLVAGVATLAVAVQLPCAGPAACNVTDCADFTSAVTNPPPGASSFNLTQNITTSGTGTCLVFPVNFAFHLNGRRPKIRSPHPLRRVIRPEVDYLLIGGRGCRARNSRVTNSRVS